MFDAYVKQAFAAKPKGYYVVNSGPIRPDDLLWSVMERRFRRADDPEWFSVAPEDAELAFCCIRKAAFQAAAGQSTKSYTIKSEPISSPAENVRVCAEAQIDLFGQLHEPA